MDTNRKDDDDETEGKNHSSPSSSSLLSSSSSLVVSSSSSSSSSQKDSLTWMDQQGRPIPIRDKNGRFRCGWDQFQSAGISVVYRMMKHRMLHPQLRVPKSVAQRKKFLPIVDKLTSEEQAKFDDCSASINVRWIGHATCLLRMSGGWTVLTDPVFSKHCAPIQAGIPRYTPPALSIQDLPQIDIVLISHDHYDHLDLNSLREIHQLGIMSERGKYFVPLGTKELLLRKINGLKSENVIEMTWWETYTLTNNSKESLLDLAIHGNQNALSGMGSATITCAPAQHWCSRLPYDRNQRLWCSWAVKTESTFPGNNDGNNNENMSLNNRANFYFAGDTGYTPDFKFHKVIGEHLGPFDLAALPIGAYEPYDVLHSQHCSPEEAVQIHRELRSKCSLGIHWGTWPLANEAFFEPAFRLKNALDENNLSISHDFILVKGGEVTSIPLSESEREKWDGLSLHPILTFGSLMK